MHSEHIINKLKLLTILPIVIISIGFIFFTINSYDRLTHLSSLKTEVQNIKNIATLINQIQQERGISSGYIGSQGNSFKQELKGQRQLTDYTLKIFQNFQKKHCPSTAQHLIDLESIRTKIDYLSLSNIESFDYFTVQITSLLNQYLKMTMKVKDHFITKHLQSYTSLELMKESLGQLRGAFNGIFALAHPNHALLYKIIHAKGIYDTAQLNLEATVSHEIFQKILYITNSEHYQSLMDKIDFYTLHTPESFNENPHEWWKNITIEIRKFYNLEKFYFSVIDDYLFEQSQDTILELILNIVAFIIFAIIVFWLGLMIKENILRNISLLDDYRQAVDRSSIVSKTNKKGIITYVNDKFCSISQYSREELLGKPHSIIRHPDMPKEAFKAMWATILNKEAWSGIVKNRKKDGSFYTVEATINPILNHKGEIEEFIAIRNDITSVIQLQQELERTQKDLIFKMGELGETRSMETGFHVRRVAEYSALLATYYGLSKEEIKYLTLASPMHDIGKIGIPDSILNKPGKLTNDEWEMMKTHTNIGHNLFKDSKQPLLQTAATIAYTHHEKYDGSGYPNQLKGEEIHIFGRITAIADVFDALGSDRCYKQAWDDAKIFALLQQERGKHFDPKLIDIFFKHIDQFKAIRKQFQDETPHQFIKPTFALDESKLFDLNPIAMIVVDSQRIIQKVNQKFTSLFGFEERELLGQTTEMITISSDYYESYKSYFQETQNGIIKSKELEYKRKDGSTFWVKLEGMPLEQRDQSPYILWSFLDIDQDIKAKQELKILNHELSDLATKDGLTTLHNRRYLMEISNDIFHFHKQDTIPLCVLMLDIDNFKRLNDTYGHLKGDEVLKSLAQLMKKFFEKRAIVCRYGGEEFIVIFRNLPLNQTKVVANTLRQKVEEQQRPLPITISIGISELHPEDTSLQDTILRADKALYQAKENGRNRVEIFEG